MKPITFFVFLLLASSSFGDTTPELIAKLKSSEANVRRVAAKQLGKAKATEAIPALGELLKDVEEEVFVAALASLEQMEAKSVPVLLAALKQELEPKKPSELSDFFKEKKEPRKLAILKTLYMLSPDAKEAVPVLSELLKNKSVDVRIGAAQALGEVTGEKKLALPALFEAAKDMGNHGSIMSATIMKRSDNKLYPSTIYNVCEAAIIAAKKLDPTCLESLAKAAIPALTTALKTNDQGIRFAASCAFVELGQYAAPAKKELEQAYREAKGGFSEIKLRRVLNELNGEEGYSRISRILNNPTSSAKERVEAISSLGSREIPLEKSLPLLQKALKDPSFEIRFKSLEVLRNLGRKAKPAISEILSLLNDDKFTESKDQYNIPGSVQIDLALFGPAADIVPPIITFIKSENSNNLGRYYASMILRNYAIQSQQYREDFKSLIDSPLAAVSLNATASYGLAGGDINLVNETLSTQMNHESDVVKKLALEAITYYGHRYHPFAPDLKKLLHHDNIEVRVKTLRALKRVGVEDKSTISAIAELVKSNALREKYEAALTLNALGKATENLPPFPLGALMHQGELNIEIVTLLGPPAKAAIPLLLKLLTDRKSETKQIVAALGAIGPEAKAAIPKLVDLLKHQSSEVVAEAAKSLGLIGVDGKIALPQLKEMSASDHRRTRIWVLFALAKISGNSETYVPKLVDLWSDMAKANSFMERVAIAEIPKAMALLGKDAKPAQKAMLEWIGSPQSQEHLAIALANFQDDADQIVPKLIELLLKPEQLGSRSSDPYAHIASCLGRFGPKAKAAIPALHALLDHPSASISRAAFDAIYLIEGKTNRGR